MTEENSFILYAEKRKNYSNCMSDVINFFEKHSESIKYNRLGNMKGCLKIMKALLNRLDDFVKYGDETELYIKDGELK